MLTSGVWLCPHAEIGWWFQSFWNCWQSLLRLPRKRWWRSQWWLESVASSMWMSLSHTKNAHHARTNWVPVLTQSHSIHELSVDCPHKNDLRFGPWYWTIHTATSIFSPPQSPRTQDGVPNCCMALRKRSKTVDVQLFTLVHRPTTCIQVTWDKSSIKKKAHTVWQYSSIIPWITIPHQINLWWLLICHM